VQVTVLEGGGEDSTPLLVCVCVFGFGRAHYNISILIKGRDNHARGRPIMKEHSLEIIVALQILKPVKTVFEAIVDPMKMSNYFISKSSGRMIEGNQVRWKFPEFEEDFLIRVGKITEDRYISYSWEIDGENLLVEMTLVPIGDDATIVTITEKGRNNDEAGIKWLMGNTAGWANFLACLKAYLEYGINLRKGAFDFLKK